MKAENFCYWLQGYFEISGVDGDTMTTEKIECIRKHLALVFKHDIDPKQGSPEHQAELNEIHNPPSLRPPGGGLMRC